MILKKKLYFLSVIEIRPLVTNVFLMFKNDFVLRVC